MPGNGIKLLAFTEEGPCTMATSTHREGTRMTTTYRQQEEVLRCPFDKSHSILPGRLLKHILKCKKNHQELAACLVVCPYSPQTHYLKPEEYDHHVEHCAVGIEKMRWFRDQKYIV